MANALQMAGATGEPSNFAPLNTDRIFTGLWTNRNPMRDAATSANEAKYYGTRQDSILGGYNSEISAKLTLRRRFGNTVFNSQIFPPIKRFYAFNTFTLTDENIRVLADTSATVYDATGPDTKNAIWQKSPGAGPTYFLGVGNNLYFTNGIDAKQWIVPPNWQANTRYYVDDKILDTNGNVEVCEGFEWILINSIGVAPSGTGNMATIVMASVPPWLGDPVRIVNSPVAALNNVTLRLSSWSNGGLTLNINQLPGSVPQMPVTNMPGGVYMVSARTSGGMSGGAAPPWGGVVVGDNEILWAKQGPAVTDWGIQPPIAPPTVTQTARDNPYASWAANTAYGGPWSGMLAIFDSVTATLQECSVDGITGASLPSFSATPGAGIVDGSTAWRCIGPSAWQANHAYAYTQAVIGNVTSGSGTVQNVFALTNEGTTGNSAANPPAWVGGVGSITHDGPDGTMQWTNVGVVHTWTADIGPNIHCVPALMTILDSNGYIQAIGQSGKTGASVPGTWNQSLGGQTIDGGTVWINSGAFAIPATAPVQYGYAFMNSATDDISNMSPASAQITLLEGNQVVVQGQGSGDAQVDTIVLYRTMQGGSTFLQLTTLPNPGANQTWTFNDTTPDSGLNVSLQAQVNGEGTPLPRGATCMEYHVGRIFVAVGNVVYVSSGPDAVASGSSGNAGFDTTFTCQSKIIRFWVNSLGLAVFTVRDSYIILGSATSTDPLYMLRWIENIPLLNYDAFSVFLTTAYLMTAKKMVMTLDPSAGIVEASRPIADLVETMNARTSYLTFHSESSDENALYLSDGATMWYRLAPTSAPESGSNWSPQALITGGMSAVQSVEIEPGEYRMLLGPPASGGPILFRDLTSNTDDGALFPVSTRFGSVVVAQPGELAALAWMTLEAQPYGTAPALAILLSEINGEFENVPRTRQDPPNLPPSQSLYSNRHSFLQNQMPVWCRHFQFTIDWPAEDAANELLTFTVFGQTWQEMRSQ